MRWALALLFCSLTVSQEWTPIVVKKVIPLGPQVSTGVRNVSRDGGFSALINGNIVWLYDDTECFDSQGRQISFVPNSAAYASEPNQNLSLVTDFDVIEAEYDFSSKNNYAKLPSTWIPFSPDELDFNRGSGNKERVAICELTILLKDCIMSYWRLTPKSF